MCSVVEIKNDDEYYIYYHSPESLETVTTQSTTHQSLDYHHLFKVNHPHSDSDDQMNENDDLKSDDVSDASTKKDDKSGLTSIDKDFSVEEYVPDNNAENVNLVDDCLEASDNFEEPVKEALNDYDHEKIDNNNCLDNNDVNCEKAEDILGDQMSSEIGYQHVNGQFDQSNEG